MRKSLGGGADEDYNQVLAACGYRFEALDDINRARNGGEYDELKACRVVKIIYCI